MNKTLVFLIIILSVGCATDNQQNNKNDKSTTIDEPFDITCKIDIVDTDLYSLAVSIELENGSYFISPYSKDTIYGQFNISIEESSNLIPIDPLTETPASVAEFDTVLNEMVRFVRNKTTYKQRLKVTGQDDFELSGLIWFVLEPSCVPYEVEFLISYRSGKMEVTKTSTKGDKRHIFQPGKKKPESEMVFDKAKWNTKDGADYPYRDKMLNDIVYNDTVRSLNQNQILDLLGKPNRENENHLYYTIVTKRLGFWPLHKKSMVVKISEDSTIGWIKIYE